MKNIRLSNKKAESLIELVMALFLLSLVLFEASSLKKFYMFFSKIWKKSWEWRWYQSILFIYGKWFYFI